MVTCLTHGNSTGGRGGELDAGDGGGGGVGESKMPRKWGGSKRFVFTNSLIERFSFECRNTKTKIITPDQSHQS